MRTFVEKERMACWALTFPILKDHKKIKQMLIQHHLFDLVEFGTG
jgi:hypothetical protein